MPKSKIDLKNRALCQLFKETCDAQKKAADPSFLSEAMVEICFVIRDLIEVMDRIDRRKNVK